MKFRAMTAVGAVAIGAMTVVAGTAYADPAPAGPQGDYIDYGSVVEGRTVVTKLKGGTFELVDRPSAAPGEAQQILRVANRVGDVALEMPLSFRVGGVPVPVRATVEDSDRVLKVTPEQPDGLDTSRPVTGIVQPIASDIENQRAINDFTTKLSLGAGAGTVIGAVIGVVLGIGVGAVLGLATGAAVGCVADAVTLCVPGLIVGGLVGAVAGTVAGAVGLGIVGAAIGSGPTVTTAGVEMMNTLQAPPGTTAWADPVGPPSRPIGPVPDGPPMADNTKPR
ncbi:hypothetical protein [Nocardia mexicana]|uniref:DUF8020 domain-containing protein n=1 Tax=Nocardia mexicana TaxID=279262 RepID=A0A370GTX6_9NOCA|nr:hypothetical protein [Nocardia mexicana]RDI46686.1 hypothetical protein DFR68_11091 [Nocardia mexicana]